MDSTLQVHVSENLTLPNEGTLSRGYLNDRTESEPLHKLIQILGLKTGDLIVREKPLLQNSNSGKQRQFHK